MVVYIHYKATGDKKPFYIGCGAHYTRAYDFGARSALWKSIYRRWGCRVEIVYTCEDKSEAFAKEGDLIELHNSTVININKLAKPEVYKNA